MFSIFYSIAVIISCYIIKSLPELVDDKTLYVIVRQIFDAPQSSNWAASPTTNDNMKKQHRLLTDINYLDSVVRTINCKCNSGNYMLVVDDQNIGSLPCDDNSNCDLVSNSKQVMYKFIMKWVPYNIDNINQYCSAINERVFSLTNCRDFDYNEMILFACKAIPDEQFKFSIKCSKIKD